jgi:16S rRNA processing protein RimM
VGDDADRVLLGEIGAAQGLKGEVRLRSYTQAPADIATYGPLQDETGAQRIEIEHVRVTPKAVIARIKGVTTREAAERLNGTKLYLPRAVLPARDEDEWYVSDLIGLEAVSADGTPLGTVAAVHNFGASDVVEIAPVGDGENVLVAFTEAAVPEVDMKKRRLVLVPPEEIEDETSSGGDA